MKQYTITKVAQRPDWNKIPALSIGHFNWTEPVEISAEAKLCYDEKTLYVHLRAWEKDVRAELSAPLSSVCDDSCLEFFFRPDENDARYFNFEMNPLCSTFIGIAYNRNQICRLSPGEGQFCKEATRLPDGWEVSYEIPVSFIELFFPGYALTPGRKIYANCYKCGDRTPKPHWLSWNPCDPDVVDFHRTECFGEMVLG